MMTGGIVGPKAVLARRGIYYVMRFMPSDSPAGDGAYATITAC